jgi:hypothetical protein
MKQSAQVHYALGAPGQQVVLPDKYNGLGFKNLIYMVIEVLDFHARWLEQKDDRPPLHLIIVEEPEAHLHAQLQQVFIRQILKILPQDDATFLTQLVITTHSPHIIYESGFTPIRYFRRSGKSDAAQRSEVLNLSQFYEGSEKDTRDFLQTYMKLTHCDLFFADAVILVEGNVERLLLPLMIAKAADKLKLSYLSILEVGGAFAHCFRPLIEFLGVTTLVITDLDSTFPKGDPLSDGNTGTAAENPESEEEEESGSCSAQAPGAVTSNVTLQNWLPKLHKVSELLSAPRDAKVQKPTDTSPASIRICYQTSREVSWKNEKADLAGRTLEEAFALENLEWCQDVKQKDLHLKVTTKVGPNTLNDITEKLYRRVNETAFKKTEFALALMTKDANQWNVPEYIREGLEWLIEELEPEQTPALEQGESLIA